MKLSKNLSLKEVIKSNTATKYGIDNNPTAEHLDALKNIAINGFQPLREGLGMPIFVSSGYRSQALNDRIGGSSTSQHSKGEALDVDADVYGIITNKEIFDYIYANIDFDQLIWEYGNDKEPDWVHFSMKLKGKNRKEVLKVKKVKGKSIYSHFKP